jgi:hypothetical protein
VKKGFKISDLKEGGSDEEDFEIPNQDKYNGS